MMSKLVNERIRAPRYSQGGTWLRGQGCVLGLLFLHSYTSPRHVQQQPPVKAPDKPVAADLAQQDRAPLPCVDEHEEKVRRWQVTGYRKKKASSERFTASLLIKH
eukprot:1144139-Pelagomonas_calceolata.AAC.1